MTVEKAEPRVTMSEHTSKAFDAELRQLTRMVLDMGSLVEKQIADSLDALSTRDANVAQRVVALDPQIDALQQQIEERAILTIARRQPMAIDLREIIGALRIANDLERVGDLAKNNARRVAPLADEADEASLMLGVERLGEMALGNIRQVLASYADRNLESALAVWNGDEEIDLRCTGLFRELLTYMMEDARSISYCIQLMFCAKNIERIGDHATNIAETVYYILEGRAISESRPKGDTTTFAAALAKER
jgi:phosphate transport system protein